MESVLNGRRVWAAALPFLESRPPQLGMIKPRLRFSGPPAFQDPLGADGGGLQDSETAPLNFSPTRCLSSRPPLDRECTITILYSAITGPQNFPNEI